MNIKFHSRYVGLCFLVVLVSVDRGYSLECYVCEEQEDNSGKCTSTVMTCDYNQDRCLSLIGWGSTPYWEIGAPMQYYISKMCADKNTCEKKHNQTIRLCERIEWRDWHCSECCQGDRCNYYITLGAASLGSSLIFVIISAVMVVTF